METDTRQADWREANPAKYDAHLAVKQAVKAVIWKSRRVKSVGLMQLMLITISTTSV